MIRCKYLQGLVFFRELTVGLVSQRGCYVLFSMELNVSNHWHVWCTKEFEIPFITSRKARNPLPLRRSSQDSAKFQIIPTSEKYNLITQRAWKVFSGTQDVNNFRRTLHDYLFPQICHDTSARIGAKYCSVIRFLWTPQLACVSH